MASPDLRIAFIGAGAANFGGGEGPWDHASRLERMPALRAVGIADPDLGRAQTRLQERTAPLWTGCRAFADFRAMLDATKPDAAWIAVPPHAHGTLEPGRDLEAECARRGIHLLIEKPLGAARPEAVRPVADVIAKAGVIASVGYMFRYSREIGKMKEIIASVPGGPRVFVGQYDCAYSRILKPEWWDVRAMGGPIVEQATHFVDLARWLLGDAIPASVRAVAIPGACAAGVLSDVPALADGRPMGSDVPLRFRHPRATAAVWMAESGGVASLTHATLLHREKYDTRLEVWGDGLRVSLDDPYGTPVLRVRRPGTEATEVVPVEPGDPYLAEDEAFVEAVRTRNPAGIRSPYADALKTFELTWAITDAAVADAPVRVSADAETRAGASPP